MDTMKIKIKIGEHEFEAEGPSEIVQSQFDAFKELIRSEPRQIVPPKSHGSQQNQQNQPDPMSLPHVDLGKILQSEGRVVSLTALPESTVDAALLIMLGHKDLKNSASVTAQEIGDGLRQSGRPVPRVDRIMDGPLGDALVLKSGVKRSTKYRLTNQGLVRALTVARELSATVV
jgi:hypothetical protein